MSARNFKSVPLPVSAKYPSAFGFSYDYGKSYEFIRYAGRHDNVLSRALSQPGLWMQRITTIEPEDGMIECGIAAFLAVLPEDPETAEIQ